MMSPRLSAIGAAFKSKAQQVSQGAFNAREVYEPFAVPTSKDSRADKDADKGKAPQSDLSKDLHARFRLQAERILDLEASITEQMKAVDEADEAFLSRMKSQQRKVQEQDAAIRELQTLIASQDALVDEQQALIDRMATRQDDLESRFRRQKLMSFLTLTAVKTTMQFEEAQGETFVWFIKDVSKLRDDQAQLYSPLFTSTFHHYTFRIKACINGSGSVNEGCMSCGVNLRQGAADVNAVWPFDLRFTVRCVDLLGRTVESATIDASRETEDTIETAFAKPEEDNLLSRGWGNFLDWDEHDIENILTNDTLHLELHLYDRVA